MNKYFNIPTVILSAYLIRLLVTGASVGDAIVIIGLASLYGYFCWLLTKQEEPVNKEIKDRIVDLEEQIKVTKDALNSVKLVSNLRR